ncbi:MAG TPA: hypothetical protein VHT97_12335 [Acidimicrobiales bacterium]|nr:hypothetical protein [Acidimicrobiales bacterium]
MPVSVTTVVVVAGSVLGVVGRGRATDAGGSVGGGSVGAGAVAGGAVAAGAVAGGSAAGGDGAGRFVVAGDLAAVVAGDGEDADLGLGAAGAPASGAGGAGVASVVGGSVGSGAGAGGSVGGTDETEGVEVLGPSVTTVVVIAVTPTRGAEVLTCRDDPCPKVRIPNAATTTTTSATTRPRPPRN